MSKVKNLVLPGFIELRHKTQFYWTEMQFSIFTALHGMQGGLVATKVSRNT